MNNKYSHLLDKLVDNIFEIADGDQEFLNEIIKDYDNNFANRIEKGAQEIDALVGKLKLEFGKQKHYDVVKVISGLKKLGESKFTALFEKYGPSKNKQLILQFYRKIHTPDSEDSIKEDSFFIELIKHMKNHNSRKETQSEE